MDISRNTVTGEIKKETNLSGTFRINDWVDCIDRTTGNIKADEKPLIDTWELTQAKEKKLKELEGIKDDLDSSNYNHYHDDLFPAYEVIDGVLQTEAGGVSFQVDLQFRQVNGRNIVDIINYIKNANFENRVRTLESNTDKLQEFIDYFCDIIDSAGNFLRKGQVRLDIKLARALEGHVLYRLAINSTYFRSIKESINNSTTVAEIESIEIPKNENGTRLDLSWNETLPQNKHNFMQIPFKLMLDYISSIIYGFVAFLFLGMVTLISKLGVTVYKSRIGERFDDLEKRITKIDCKETKQRQAIKEELKDYFNTRLDQMEDDLKLSVARHASRNMQEPLDRLFKLLEKDKNEKNKY